MGADGRDNWNDDRLDDLSEDVRRMILLGERVAHIEASLVDVADDAKNCRASIHDLRNQLAVAALTAINERKSDRRWLIGTCLSAVGLVIAAAAVLLGHVG